MEIQGLAAVVCEKLGQFTPDDLTHLSAPRKVGMVNSLMISSEILRQIQELSNLLGTLLTSFEERRPRSMHSGSKRSYQ